MKNKLNFGILGCGAISDFHARAIESIENAVLYGVADKNLAAAYNFAEKYGIKAYSDFEEMLADGEIDAVCICTPSGFHAENAINALNARKHVVLEKPMALSLEDCDRVEKACDESGCKLTVICQLRFSDDVQKIKQLVKENAFGKLVFCDLYMKYWRSEEYYSSSPWKGTVKMDGGALMNQGIHGVDAMLYIMGDANIISAKTRTTYHNIEAEDTAVAMLEFENGALGVIEAATCVCPGSSRRIELRGSKGAAVLEENSIVKLVLDGEEIINTENNLNCGTANDPLAMSHLLHAKQISNFVESVSNDEELLIDCKEARRAIDLIGKIYSFD